MIAQKVHGEVHEACAMLRLSLGLKKACALESDTVTPYYLSSSFPFVDVFSNSCSHVGKKKSHSLYLTASNQALN